MGSKGGRRVSKQAGRKYEGVGNALEPALRALRVRWEGLGVGR